MTERKRQKRIKLRREIRKVQSLLAAISRVPSKYRHIKGFRAEDIALKAAVHWRKKKLILNVRATEGLSIEDRDMKDIILALLGGQEVAIQVKSYFHVDLAVIRRCREKGIWLFSIDTEEEETITINKMRDLIVSIYLETYNLKPFLLRKFVKEIVKPNDVNNILKSKKRFLDIVKGVFK